MPAADDDPHPPLDAVAAPGLDESREALLDSLGDDIARRRRSCHCVASLLQRCCVPLWLLQVQPTGTSSLESPSGNGACTMYIDGGTSMTPCIANKDAAAAASAAASTPDEAVSKAYSRIVPSSL